MENKGIPFGSDKDMAAEIRKRVDELKSVMRVAAQLNGIECKILLNPSQSNIDGIIIKKVL